MDLVTTLRRKIDALGEASCLPGLRLLLLHIEAAEKHLARGQTLGNQAAFTDAIYRTNQAFDTAIKEAYRVLAGRDPSRERLSGIESYLEDHHSLGPRVATTVANHRRQWRNSLVTSPELEFGESDAFLAILSVAEIACLLLDQFAEHLSFHSTKASTDSRKTALRQGIPDASAALIERSVAVLREFALHLPRITAAERPGRLELRLAGALRGFVASVAPDITACPTASFGPERPERYEVFTDGTQKIVVEVRAADASGDLSPAVARLEQYIATREIHGAILFVCPDQAGDLDCVTRELPQMAAPLVILTPTERVARAGSRASSRWADDLPAAPILTAATSSHCWVC